jgi:NitT/TauT family transport system substrate-binding protein
MADPKNAKEVIDIAMSQTTGFTRTTMMRDLYGAYPDQNGIKLRFVLPYTFTPYSRELINNATVFLRDIKTINVDKLKPDAIVSEFADKALQARKISAPIGSVPVINPLPQ